MRAPLTWETHRCEGWWKTLGGSGDAGRITVACERQFTQHCNAFDNVVTFRRAKGITRSLASSGTSASLLSLHSAWSHG